MPTDPRIPSFFVVGAAKAGTTSLAHYLRQHPQVYMPDSLREPAYFADWTGHDELDTYMAEFASAEPHQLVGEKSVAYLYDPQAAMRIREFYPDAKIIIALRNPVDMAYSLYRHNVREGFELITSFSEALDAEDGRAEDPDFPSTSLGYYANYLYRRRATLFPQVQRYFEVFPHRHIKVISFGDLKRNSRAVCRDIFSFLGVDDTFVPDVETQNSGGSMRFPFLMRTYLRNRVLREFVTHTVPRPVRRGIYRMNRTSAAAPPLTADEWMRCHQLFESDIEAVYREFQIQVA